MLSQTERHLGMEKLRGVKFDMSLRLQQETPMSNVKPKAVYRNLLTGSFCTQWYMVVGLKSKGIKLM